VVTKLSANAYQGLSTDRKPTGDVSTGSFFLEVDTGKTYVFDFYNINPVTNNGWWPL
jgi:hypothetical protein